MNAIPKSARLSEHAWNMTLVFEMLDNEKNKELLGEHDEDWREEMQEVLAALDAFADEQQPAEDMSDYLDLKMTEENARY